MPWSKDEIIAVICYGTLAAVFLVFLLGIVLKRLWRIFLAGWNLW